MKKKRNKIMIALCVIVGIIILTAIYFIQPFSVLKHDFNKEVSKTISESAKENSVFTKDDIKDLPMPVQRYFTYCGFLGKPKMTYIKAQYNNVNFSTGVGKPTLNIDYTQYNFSEKPVRFAFIDSSMFLIPFQGFDSYDNGIGSMKGVIAKTFTLFDQRGTEMNKACLVTFLSECLIVPSAALQKYITWESIDNNHAKAVINYYGISASGIFTFGENGEMLSFTTDDKTAVDFEGNKQNVEWSAECSNYFKNEYGIMQPSILKAVWHYKEGDLVYFDGKNVKIQYKY